MVKDLVWQLRYLGVTPKKNYREYGFRIEDEDKTMRQIVLTIDNRFFLEHSLMFQEAPDLCYQKMLTDLSSETPLTPLHSRVQVTGIDIARYRDSHPTTKGRRRPGSETRPRARQAASPE